MIRRALVLAVLLSLLPAVSADAAVSRKKAIWGPTESEAESLFPTYKALGAGIYQTRLEWDNVAIFPPQTGKDPLDASYDWPDEIDTAIDEARRNGIDVALTVSGTPDWASRSKPKQLADFLTAAARRYPAVHLWTIGEAPLKLSGRTYARQLDAAYAALKARSRRNLVVGGASSGAGALKWIRALKLPNGKAPRMDLYGHLASPSRTLTAGDVKAIARASGKRLFLNLSLPAGSKQASRLRAALKVARSTREVYSLGYRGLYDDGDTRTGLIDLTGSKRSAYTVFRRG